jgi:hypothetical protein
MSQGFDPNVPGYRSPLDSSEIRTQLTALNTAHSGPTAPASPQEGQSWLDTSNQAFKRYLSGGWRTIFTYDALGNITVVGADVQIGHSIDFYPGTVSPLVVQIDKFDIEESAAFEPGVDQDIVFNLKPPFDDYEDGVQLWLIYAMSTSESADVVLTLDYTVHDSGEAYDGGTDYTNTQTVTPLNVMDNLGVLTALTIPSGVITGDTVEIEARLTRDGDNAADTHGGEFGLKNIVILPL